MRSMKKFLCFTLFLLLLIGNLRNLALPVFATGISNDGLTITAGRLKMTLNDSGTITGLLDDEEDKDYKLDSNLRPMVTLYMDGNFKQPVALSYSNETYTLTYENDVTVDVEITIEPSYLTLEVVAIGNDAGRDIEYLYWGPITTDFQEYGDALGVAYNDDFAIGMFGINVKTVGGQGERLPQIIDKDSSRPVRFSNKDKPWGQ